MYLRFAMKDFTVAAKNTKYPNGVSYVKQSRENCEINKSKLDANKSHL